MKLSVVIPVYNEAETIREVIVANFRIVYSVHDDTVQILAISHGSRRLPSDLLDEQNEQPI